ncbi:uncharacterized protein EV420DRAFT_1768324 [Desarmillaria tabescens]|uniref:HNH nuclease domain-containing protein n=1 Tax=Armillaria tabescens TaxID=1929756 RepID=A0AA39JM13_ARMTA|nr:uncharacterized protein EV420DRAFT_1768324 [Desarmillaria tabescens]KAK0444206.1 hypothetical protein EV420DRAFT_1768324 [Desarmillaria tabescens]
MSHLSQASDFNARALPPKPFSAADLPEVHAAFNLCLSLEARAPLVPLPHRNHPAVVVCARVLGFTLIEAPSDDGRDHMANSINSGNNDKTLLALGKNYIERLLRSNLQRGEHLLRRSIPLVRISMIRRRLCKYILQQASLNYSTAKQAALVRDGFHCMIKTHLYEDQYFGRNESTIVAQDPECNVSTLRCVHILPEGLNSDLGSIEVPTDKSMMYMFGIHMEELNGAGIHRLENILTLNPSFRDFFDQLGLWLEAVDNQPNTYTVVSTLALPLPSPAYLAIHAACCRVAHLSGAAEYVEKVLQEEEEIREQVGSMCVLAEDGSSMDLLERYIAVHVV